MSTGVGFYHCPYCGKAVWFDDTSEEDHSCDGLVKAQREARLLVQVPIDLYQQLLWGLRSGTPLWERAVAISRKWAEDNPDLFAEGVQYEGGPVTVIEMHSSELPPGLISDLRETSDE